MPRLYAYDANEFTQKNVIVMIIRIALTFFKARQELWSKLHLKLNHAWESSKRDRIP